MNVFVYVYMLPLALRLSKEGDEWADRRASAVDDMTQTSGSEDDDDTEETVHCSEERQTYTSRAP